MKPNRSHHRSRIIWGAISALLLLLAIPPVRAAEGQVTKIGVLKFESPPATQKDNRPPAGVLIMNPAKRRAFQIYRMEVGKRNLVRVLDLDTLKPLGEVIVNKDISTAAGRANGAQYAYALDEEENVLYLPYSISADGTYVNYSGVDGVVGIDGDTFKVVTDFERLKSSDPTAAARVDQGAVADDNDVSDVVTPCTAAACLPSVPGVSPFVLAMDLVPPYLSGGNPKILMFWGEPTGPFLETNSYLSHVVQWDAVTGRQDFIYEVRACASRAVPANDSSRYPLSIFQARLGSGIYIGCNASGGTGQVVRIVLDANGKPSAEETFPGPTNVTDILADKLDDRVLFRVANEEGESIWVFNGSASSYSGVVGITIQPVAVGYGLDPENGRLYALAPPQSVGNQSSPGGILMSDVRRNPAPQALVFPEHAAQGFSEIAVDWNAPNGERHLFVRNGAELDYQILRDEVPVTTDPPLTDLDRFTADVEEQEGVTSANFTGTGHAYGVRALLVGGADGVPPGGPDASGLRIGRFTPHFLGSPCTPTDRSITVGSVQEAQLSNNISNAAATSAETDAGTITDTRQPSQRCYPHPSDIANFDDPFRTAYPYTGGYPRPLDGDADKNGISDADEVAGNDWPFGISQCASGGNASTTTKLKPGDRGPTVPNDIRKQEAEFKGLRAQTRCNLEGADVMAQADAAPFEQTDLSAATKNVPKVPYPQGAPSTDPRVGSGATTPEPQPNEIGFIRIAEGSSFSHVRRDKKLGLVSESFAYVRGVNIGDKVFIDAAFTYALSRAAGRPGTASTTFVRRLCGVRIPDFGINVDAVDLDTDPVHVGDPVYDNGSQLFPNGIELPPVVDAVPNNVDLPDTGVAPPGIGIPTDTLPRNIGVPSQNLGDVDPANPDSEDQRVTDSQINDFCGDPGIAQAGSQPVIDNINKALGSRGRVSAPQPDTELRGGSPGGYLASIQKDRLQQVGARAVQNDDSTQVPALEIVLFNDDPKLGRGRQVYQLAGVDASVTYGIYLLNPPDEGGDPFDGFEGKLVDVTTPGGDFFGDNNTPEQPTSNGPKGPLGPIKILYEGVTFLLRSPKDAALAAAVWALLFAPVHLMLRRRALRSTA